MSTLQCSITIHSDPIDCITVTVQAADVLVFHFGYFVLYYKRQEGKEREGKDSIFTC